MIATTRAVADFRGDVLLDRNMLNIDSKLRAFIPPLTDEEVKLLEANLIADGCRDPLVVWKERDILLDGHHRLKICKKHGLPFKTKALSFPDREAAADWMDANQLGRRNLTRDQKDILTGRIYSRTKKRHGGDRRSSAQNAHLVSEKTAEKIAAKLGVNQATVRRAAKKYEAIEKLAETHPEEAQAVKDGKKKFNEVRRTIKREAVKKAAKLPNAKYRVIYADPPWKYGDQLTESYGPTKFQYPSMTIKELCAMPVKKLCEPNAVLFLWVTSPLLYEAAPIISAWGFKYKTSFVWDKVKHNMGHYNSMRHELLLVCTRGSCTPDNPKLFDSVQSIERGKHSEKPERFRKIIDTLYPHGKKLELFARREAEGWSVYGNQLGRRDLSADQRSTCPGEGVHEPCTAELSTRRRRLAIVPVRLDPTARLWAS